MALSFEKLVESVIFDVAVAGDRGIGVHDVAKSIKTFYEPEEGGGGNVTDQEDLLFSDAPPPTPVVIDAKFIDTVWSFVSGHPDVETRSAEERSNSTDRPSNEGVGIEVDAQKDSPASASKNFGSRLFTNEKCVWQAIAGHEIDRKRIPQKAFECLLVIAAGGAQGCIQPDVTRLTGQDKRSVPKRTDQLCEKGYITKQNIVCKGSRTTILKLTRFSKGRKTSTSEKKRTKSKNKQSDDQKLIYYDEWFNDATRLLTENDGIMALTDIRIGLGISGQKWETKAFARCYARLANVGMIRKVNARVEGTENYNRCLQLMREPTEADRVAFTSSKPPKKPSQLIKNPAANRMNDPDALDEEEHGNDDNDDDDDAAMEKSPGRVPPRFMPGQKYANFLYDLIKEAGVNGISSMELCKRSMGSKWRRPLDEIMNRLTDIWQTSQPPHLNHLTIVKDTAQTGKIHHFLYRTIDNFEKAVEAGDTEWAAVQGDGRKGKKKATKEVAVPKIDKWGFPELNPDQFVGSDGRASLSECQKGVEAQQQKFNATELRLKKSTNAGNLKGLAPKTRTKPLIRSAQNSNSTPANAVLQDAIGSSSRTAVSLKRKAVAGIGDATPPQEESVTISDIRPRKRRPSVNLRELKNYQENARKLAKTLARAEFNRTKGQTTDAQASDSNVFDLRVSQIEAEIVSREKPGVYINPPGSKELWLGNRVGSGRPPKHVLVVFKSDRLKDLPWFKQHRSVETTVPSDSLTINEHIGLNGVSCSGEGTVDGISRKKRRVGRKSIDESLDVDIVPLSQNADFSASRLKTPVASTPIDVPKKRGRPTKAMVAERKRKQEAEKAAAAAAAATTADDQVTASSSKRLRGRDTPLEEPPRKKRATAISSGTSGPGPSTPVDHTMPDAISLPSESQNQALTDANFRCDLPHEDQVIAEGPSSSEVDNAFANMHSESSEARCDDTIQQLKDGVTSTDEFNELSQLRELSPAALEELSHLKTKEAKKAGTTKSGGIVRIRRERLVMDAVHQCHGVFPGNKVMWYPFVTAWQKRQPGKPDRHTVDNAVSNLVADGKLKKLQFDFTDKKGRRVVSHMLLLPETDPSSTLAKKMQKAMIDAHPQKFLPPEVEIADNLLKRGQHRRGSCIANTQPNPNGSPEKPFHYNVEFPIVEGVTVKRTTDAVRIADNEARRLGFDSAEHWHNSKHSLNQVAFVNERKKRARKRSAKGGSGEVTGNSDNFDTSDSDENLPISKEQAALQNDFQLNSYTHDSSAVHSRPKKIQPTYSLSSQESHNRQLRKRSYADVVSKKILDELHRPYPDQDSRARSGQNSRRSRDRVNRRKTLRRHISLLMRPQQSFYSTSGTFATCGVAHAPVLTDSKAKSNSKRKSKDELAHLGPDFAHVQPVPEDLEEILKQVQRIGRAPVQQVDNPDTPFFNNVESVKVWESHICRTGARLETGPQWNFVNLKMHKPHVHSDDDAAGRNIEFINQEDDHYLKTPRGPKRRRVNTDPATSAHVGLRRLKPALASGNVKRVSFDLPSVDDCEPALRKGTKPKPSVGLRNGSRRQPTSQNGVDVSKRTGKPKSIPKSKKRPAPDNDPANGEDQGPPAPKRRRRSNRPREVEVRDLDRLLIAVVLARIFCDWKRGSRAPWNVIEIAMNYKYDQEKLRRSWTRYKNKNSGEIWADALQKEMEKSILTACAKGQLPFFDLDEVFESDWFAMVLWAEKKVLPRTRGKDLDLSVSRKKLVSQYELGLVNNKRDYEPDAYFTGLSGVARYRVAAKFNMGCAVADDGLTIAPKAAEELDQNQILLKSFARAVAVTPEADYNAKQAAAKISQMGVGKLQEASSEMLKSKTFVQARWKRQMPGRNYSMSAFALKQFKRWKATSDEIKFFSEIAEARTGVLAHFQTHEQMDYDEDVNEAQNLVLTNMVAQGLLNILPVLPERNDDFDAPPPKLSAWGHRYDARWKDAELLSFSLKYSKTAAFTDQHGLKYNVPIPMQPPSFPNETGLRTPFWVGTGGKLIPEIWGMVVRSVLYLIVFRTGSTAESIEKAHKSKLWVWEADMVLRWMEEVEIIQRFGAGKEVDGVWKGGWRASQWWYCASLPGIASSLTWDG